MIEQELPNFISYHQWCNSTISLLFQS